MKPEYIWFLIGIFLLIMELATPGLIVAFFGLGAIIVGIVCLVTDITLNMQLVIFLGASLLSIALLRKWLKGIFMGRTSGRQGPNEDLMEVIGQKVIVKEKIAKNIGGKVELHGTNWNATSDEEIEAGAVVEITGKESLTLKVKKLK
jgi:inner membrane protein